MNSEVNYIPLFTPNVPQSAIEAVSRTLNSRWIGQGPQVDEFEELLSKTFCGGDPGIAVGSGTDALHLAYLLAGIGPGDEVIVPDMTWVATANAVKYVGAKPIFADIEYDKWTLDAGAVERLITNKTKAIIPAHLYGHPANMTQLLKISKKYNLKIKFII